MHCAQVRGPVVSVLRMSMLNVSAVVVRLRLLDMDASILLLDISLVTVAFSDFASVLRVTLKQVSRQLLDYFHEGLFLCFPEL